MKVDYNSNYQGCFVCGKKNHEGMKLDFFYDEREALVFTKYRFKDFMQGFSGLVHGGFLSMLLDEVMAKACLQKGLPAVTARFEVWFRKPVFVGEEMTFQGRVKGVRGKKIEVEALCIDGNGNKRASAMAIFVKSEM
ncbi:MAG: PaaI family thioesterase [Spirochaetota bacterium]